MLQQKAKKKPPPRPPPPNFIKYKSKSSFNLSDATPNLINWSPPSSPKPQHTYQFGGSVSSSYSSSSSSLTSSKRSLENDNYTFTSANNWITTNSFVQRKENPNVPKPRIIRPAPLKQGVSKKESSVGNSSPPMPSIPPPSPPKGEHSVVTPYGIAIYDFPATQAGDLPLQVNDIVILIRRVNEEWLYGKIFDKEGIFPANFIQIEVPLQGEEQIVTALYDFRPQVTGDLPLKLGQKIKVIKKISNEWLYGESDGQFGQFPSNFVEY